MALLAAMYLAYVINVCSSSAVEIAVPLLAADDGVALGMAELSSGMAAGQVATVLGKVVAGPVVDGRGASAAFPEALLVMGAALALGVLAIRAEIYPAALLCFCLFKAAKASVWPAMAMAAKSNFQPALLSRCWSILTTSSRAGAVSGGFVLSPLVAHGWSGPPLAVAVGLGAMFLLLTSQLRGAPSSTATSSAAKDGGGGDGFGDALRVLAADRQLCLLFATMAFLLPVMEISGLLPTFVAHATGLPVGSAAQIASAFPLGMVVATFGGGFVFDSLTPTLRVAFLLVMTGGGSVAVAILAQFGGAASASGPVVAALLFCVGAGIGPALYIKPHIFIMQNVDERLAGKMLAMLDMPGYLLSAVSFQLQPVLLELGGWTLFFRCLAVLVALAAVCVSYQQHLQNGEASARPKRKAA